MKGSQDLIVVNALVTSLVRIVKSAHSTLKDQTVTSARLIGQDQIAIPALSSMIRIHVTSVHIIGLGKTETGVQNVSLAYPATNVFLLLWETYAKIVNSD